ncbi:MAG: polysaccharide biosynthesis/export family protein [Candidatus Zixiibacteriota bacterium]
MKTYSTRKLLAAILLTAPWLLILTGESASQEYVIGVDDGLSVSFWQQPQLNVSVKVGENGCISLPIIGEIEASGMTKKQLAEEIASRISLYDPTISQATVLVSDYGSQRVYVQGEVLHPGKYSFESIPGLWELLGEAGGPTEHADLSSVTIIRVGTEEKMITVDLDRCLKSGELSQLPQLKPKDIINIPPSALSSTSSRPIPISIKKGGVYYLWGEVISPGAYPFESQIDLMEAISLAGGPTSMANLKKVKLITREKDQDVISLINVDQYLRKGTRPSFVMGFNDIIIVPTKKPGTLSQTWGVLREAVTVAGAGASIYLLVHTLKKD